MMEKGVVPVRVLAPWAVGTILIQAESGGPLGYAFTSNCNAFSTATTKTNGAA